MVFKLFFSADRRLCSIFIPGWRSQWTIVSDATGINGKSSRTAWILPEKFILLASFSKSFLYCFWAFCHCILTFCVSICICVNSLLGFNWLSNNFSNYLITNLDNPVASIQYWLHRNHSAFINFRREILDIRFKYKSNL